MKSKKYRWNKKTFLKNCGKGIAMLAICAAFNLALFAAFFPEI